MKFIINFLSTILVVATFGCQETTDSRFVKGSEIKDSLNEFRFIRDTTFDKLHLNLPFHAVEMEDIIGIWQDTATLVFENGKWQGWRPIDKTKTLTFYKSSKYLNQDSYRESKSRVLF